MERKDIIDYLDFRKKFTKREWFELNQAVSVREKEKADELQLDDLDISLIVNRVTRFGKGDGTSSIHHYDGSYNQMFPNIPIVDPEDQ